jgi:hypothetical protein
VLREGTVTKESVEQFAAKEKIVCMACGQMDNTFKFYFYSKTQQNSCWILSEVLIDLLKKNIAIQIKSPRPDLISQYFEIIKKAFSPFAYSNTLHV